MVDTDCSLAGKAAVITGAGRGIGRAIAMGYARAGAAICCAARTESEIQETVAQIRNEGGTALAVQTDVTQWIAVQELFDTADSQLGGIDIAVINAGINSHQRIVEDSDPDAWEATLHTNLLGAYYCAKAAISALRKRGGGKIITIGSGLGHSGRPGSSAYSCSKAALWMLTRTLAQELWQYNISVNELIPGPVETQMSRSRGDGESVFGRESEWIKSPEEVVPMALFLATQPEVGPTAQSFSLMRRDT